MQERRKKGKGEMLEPKPYGRRCAFGSAVFRRPRVLQRNRGCEKVLQAFGLLRLDREKLHATLCFICPSHCGEIHQDRRLVRENDQSERKVCIDRQAAGAFDAAAFGG